MNQGAAIGLGAIAGATIFLGLPVARMHGLPKPVQGFLNAFATGILVFLLWDIVSHAAGPVEAAITQGHRGPFAAMAVIFAVGIAVGLLGLVYFNRTVFSHLRHEHANPSARSLSLAIATGLGLHNLSEGLAIGESAHVGAIAFTGVLAFLGTWIGFLASSTYFSIAFLAVAAGALLYVLNELFSLGRKISTPPTFAWGLLLGFLTAFATDLFLTAVSGA